MTGPDIDAGRNRKDLQKPGHEQLLAGSPTPDAEPEAELASYRAALNRQAVVGMTDRAGVIVAVNDRFCQLSQYSREELIGGSHNVLNSGHHPPEFFKDLWRRIAAGDIWHGDICNRAKDGTLYWVDTTIVPKWGADGRIAGYVSVRYDITARKAAEARLIEEYRKRQDAELLLRDIIEAVPNGLAAYEENGRLILFNSAFQECYPLASAAIFEGTTFENILRTSAQNGQFALAVDTPVAREAFIAVRLQNHENPGRQFVQHLSDGRWLQVEEQISRTGHLVSVRTDISQLKEAEQQIKRQAEHDALTGLYNRRVVLDRLNRALTPTRSERSGGALVVIDLDGFKAINDTQGHDAGDALLVAVAARLKHAVRKTDVVARLGGDEFAVILNNLNTDRDAARIAEKLLQALHQPMKIAKRPVIPSASLGVALFPRDGRTPHELMKNADLALYQAKAKGRSTYVLCSPELRQSQARRASLTKALRSAMSRGRIEVALQPQVDVATAEHTGFEALVRWQLGRRPVPPPELIAVAEEAGLIVPLGYYVIDRALAAIRELSDVGLHPGRVAVNVSADQLREPDFAGRLCDAIRKHRLTPLDVEVEVTENVVLERASERIAATLTQLHDAGVAIALDDFGTGYASLSHLQRFHIDRLKIDQSFVRDIAQSGDDGVIARTVISLAHNLGMTVVAEGVETEEQLRFLSRHGCDFMQGYLISRPMFLDGARIYLLGVAERSRHRRRWSDPPPGEDVLWVA